MSTPTTYTELVNSLLNLINLLVPVIIGVVFVVLAFKIFDAWVVHADDEKKQEEGRQYAITGVIVMVVVVVIWGIVALIKNSIFG
ncbi:MAG: hypothetical protein R3B53_02775 [Candidatus Paceibacterota bacterium]